MRGPMVGFQKPASAGVFCLRCCGWEGSTSKPRLRSNLTPEQTSCGAAQLGRQASCMKIEPNRAKLLVELPAERYKAFSSQGRTPRIGDVVVLDQGFTGSDGSPMVLAYFPGFDDPNLYEAVMYESELEQRP